MAVQRDMIPAPTRERNAFTLRMEPRLHQRLKKQARRENKSINLLVVEMIDAELKRRSK